MTGGDKRAWFAPKRYGYGAGLPIAWQGWALIAAYLLVVGVGVLLVEWDPQVGLVGAIALIIPATIAFLVIAALRTRGGWRWRWGSKD